MSETSKSKSGAWLGRNLLLVIGLTVLAISAGVYFLQTPSKSAELSKQESIIEQLEAAQSGITPPEEADVINEVVASATGLSLERQERDWAAGEAIVAQATNWESDESYVVARDGLKDDFGFTDEDEFLITFMPGPDQGAYRIAPSGEIFFAMPGLNSRLDDFEATLVSTEGDVWTYFAIAQVTSSHSNGGVATNDIAVVFSADSDSNVVDIMAYPSADVEDFG